MRREFRFAISAAAVLVLGVLAVAPQSVWASTPPVWLIVSVALAAAIVAPFVAPAEVLYGVFPECEAKRRGSACSLCGMTTAFVQISNGDLAGAQSSNSGSIALWSASS